MNLMNPNKNFDDLHKLKQSDIIEYYSFYDLDNNLLNVQTITLDNYGQLSNVTINTESGTQVLTKDEYTYTRECIFVLGIGYLIPGDIVKLHLMDKCSYELRYGWHTNVSNQCIHSWYLVPVSYDLYTKDVVYKTDSDILTLYKHYLETIEVVEFKKNRSSFYAGGEPISG